MKKWRDGTCWVVVFGSGVVGGLMLSGMELRAEEAAEKGGSETCADYSALGSIQVNPLLEAGVLATGSDDLVLVSGSGMGVLGGTLDSFINTGESVRFDLDGGVLAGSLTYTLQTWGNGDADAFVGEAEVTGYGAGGASIGTVMVVGASVTSVTDLFGGAVLSGFMIAPVDGDHMRLRTVCWIEAEPFCAGDLDGDGDTDVLDFGILAVDFGCDVGP